MSTGFIENVAMVMVAHTLYNGLLGRALNSWQTGKQGIVSMGLDGEFRINRHKLRPWHVLKSLKKILKGFAAKLLQAPPDPIGTAQPHVGSAYIGGSSLK